MQSGYEADVALGSDMTKIECADLVPNNHHIEAGSTAFVVGLGPHAMLHLAVTVEVFFLVRKPHRLGLSH